MSGIRATGAVLPTRARIGCRPGMTAATTWKGTGADPGVIFATITAGIGTEAIATTIATGTAAKIRMGSGRTRYFMKCDPRFGAAAGAKSTPAARDRDVRQRDQQNRFCFPPVCDLGSRVPPSPEIQHD